MSKYGKVRRIHILFSRLTIAVPGLVAGDILAGKASICFGPPIREIQPVYNRPIKDFRGTI